jgi:hypothetical protein
LGKVHTLLCARFIGDEGISLEDYSKIFWLGFLPLLRRVSQDTSCVFVHGVSSSDLGCYNIMLMIAAM